MDYRIILTLVVIVSIVIVGILRDKEIIPKHTLSWLEGAMLLGYILVLIILSLLFEVSLFEWPHNE
jgi:hypothetical protein